MLMMLLLMPQKNLNHFHYLIHVLIVGLEILDVHLIVDDHLADLIIVKEFHVLHFE
jgi:hypothetical protein